MPDVPHLKTYPYDTDTRCVVCHPANRPEPPFMQCVMEIAHGGNNVERQLVCPNCDARDADVYNTITKRVIFNKSMDIQAARGR